jgi:membrane-associated phospholipid phosphatase
MFGNRRLNWIVFGTLPALSLISYFVLDRRVALFFADIPDPLMAVLSHVTEIGQSTWYLAAGLIGVLVFRFIHKRPGLYDAAMLMLLSVVVSGVATNILKLLIGRSRPYNLLRTGEYGFAPMKIDYAYNSFPSGHTATVVAVALSLSIAFPRLRMPLYGVGVIVACTRILMNHHFVSDVIMGGVLATAVTLSLAHRRFGRP